MARKTASILVIDKAKLDQLPAPIKDFVERHFEKKDNNGEERYYAFRIPGIGGLNGRKGVIFSASQELARYCPGLDECMTLREWFTRAVKRGLIWEMSSSWDDTILGVCVETGAKNL